MIGRKQTILPLYPWEAIRRRWRQCAWWRARLVTFGRLYLTGLVIWAILQTFFGDRWWWLFLLNSGSAYLFLPLPLVVVIALFVQQREVWYQVGLILALWVLLFMPSYLPIPTRSSSNGPILTVSSYNLFGFNENPPAVIAAIRETGADVVALQELNPQVAEAIRRNLRANYPYQVLDPRLGVTGAGVISRYPLYETGQTLPGGWIGEPQVLQLDFADTPITILNFHAYPFTLMPPGDESLSAGVEWTTQERERQVEAVLKFVAANPGPLIAMTDLNAGDKSQAYQRLTQVLKDGWRQAGWGPGHTFPGEASLAGIPLPDWLIRIDYVFHSPAWRTTSAHVGPWDGYSDHRPVVVQLSLMETVEAKPHETVAR